MADEKKLKNIIIGSTVYQGVQKLSVRDNDDKSKRDLFLSESYIEDNTTLTINKNGDTVNVNVPSSGGVEEVATTAAMNALLVEANVGKYYKFTGPTDSNYTNGNLYLVESV